LAVAAYPLIAKDKMGMCHNKDVPFLYPHTYPVSKKVYLFCQKG